MTSIIGALLGGVLGALSAWSGPPEFTAGYRFETSDDLRSWRPGGAGQLVALASLARGHACARFLARRRPSACEHAGRAGV